MLATLCAAMMHYQGIGSEFVPLYQDEYLGHHRQLIMEASIHRMEAVLEEIPMFEDQRDVVNFELNVLKYNLGMPMKYPDYSAWPDKS